MCFFSDYRDSMDSWNYKKKYSFLFLILTFSAEPELGVYSNFYKNQDKWTYFLTIHLWVKNIFCENQKPILILMLKFKFFLFKSKGIFLTNGYITLYSILNAVFGNLCFYDSKT